MVDNWQGDFFAVKDRNRKLLEKGCWSDVRFAISDGTEERKVFHAHKLILANASLVFAKMFFGSLPENTEQAIEIEDVHPETFSKLLKYIYTDAVDLKSWKDAVDLFSAAKLYMLCRLEKYCIKYLMIELQVSNALKIYEFAKFHEQQTLVEAALKVIKEETLAVLDSKDFPTIDISTMITLLEQDKLQATELELFNALETLAKSQGAIKNTTQDGHENIENNNVVTEESRVELLGKFRTAVKKIQFLLMTAEQFAIGAALSELLLREESEAITSCLLLKNIYPKGFVQGIRPSKRLPRVFFEISIEGNLIGRIVVELRSDVVPKRVEKIRTVFNDDSLSGYKALNSNYTCSTHYEAQARLYATKKFIRFYLSYEDFMLNHNVPGTFGILRHPVDLYFVGFYITFQKCENINYENVAIGQIIEGMNVVETIKSYGSESSKSTKKVFIKSCGKF